MNVNYIKADGEMKIMKGALKKYNVVFIAAGIIVLCCAAFFVVRTVKNMNNTVAIGIAMPNNVQKRWEMDTKSLLDKFNEKNYRTVVRYADDDVYLQVNQIEEMINEKVDVLLITPVKADSLRDIVEKAKSKGIYVIAYDRMITNTDLVDYYITFKNYDVGRLQAEYIVEKLGLLDENNMGPYNLEIFAGDTDDFNSKYYFRGAMAVLKKYIDDGKIIIRSGESEFNQCATERWNYKIAANRMRTILDTHYKDTCIDAVVCGNDGLTMGIYDILVEKGYENHMPVLTGQDAEIDYVKIIKDNDNMMTVFKDTRLLANETAILVDDILNGNEPKINNTNDYSNGKKRVNTYEMVPVSIDRENYSSLLVESGYIPPDSL